MMNTKLSKFIVIAIFILAGILRFYKIDVNPPGLYIDEASIGYNAYSILKTGKDEYGVNYPLWFRSFGDYKAPVYIYTVSASMFAFGKNEFAVRFPSALAGTLTVIVLYFFLKELLKFDKSKFLGKKAKFLPALSAFLLAISTWHLQFSRAGFEVNVAVFLYLLASYLAILYFNKKEFIYLLLSYLFYILTIYTYFSFRVISPITLLVLSILIFWKLPNERIKLVIVGIFCLLLSVPVLQFSLTQNGAERFFQTSAFVEYPTKSLLEEVVVYPMVFVKNYLSYFSLSFLFNSGDGIGRHQIAGFGLLSLWEFPFVFLGLFYLLKSKKNIFKYITLGLLILSSIPAATARPSPHTLRSLLMVIPFIMIISIGILFALERVGKWSKMFVTVLSIFIIYGFFNYLHFYYNHYPNVNVLDWGAGYKQMVEKASLYENKFDEIVIDQNFNYALVYFDFYNNELARKVRFVNGGWKKPKELKNKRVLFIRYYYKKDDSYKVIDNVSLSNVNHDIFAQFCEL